MRTGRKSGTDVYSADLIPKRLITANPDRLNYIRYAMSQGLSVEEAQELTDIDPWFLSQIKTVVDFQQQLSLTSLDEVSPAMLRQAKRYGLSDNRLGRLVEPDRDGGTQPTQGMEHPRRVQACRYVRGGIREASRRTSTRYTKRSAKPPRPMPARS